MLSPQSSLENTEFCTQETLLLVFMPFRATWVIYFHFQNRIVLYLLSIEIAVFDRAVGVVAEREPQKAKQRVLVDVHETHGSASAYVPQ